MEPSEGRQQRGVNVEMAVAPTINVVRGVQPQEARVAEKLDARLVERRIKRGVEGFARGEVLVVDGERRDERCFRAQQSLRLRHIGNDEHDLGWIVALLAGIDQGLQVRAPARDENADAFLFGHRVRLPMKRTPCWSWRRSRRPRCQGRPPASRKQASTASALVRATTITMPTPQLNVLSISASSSAASACSQRNAGSRSKERRLISAASEAGSTRGMFSVKPPPVI